MPPSRRRFLRTLGIGTALVAGGGGAATADTGPNCATRGDSGGGMTMQLAASPWPPGSDADAGLRLHAIYFLTGTGCTSREYDVGVPETEPTLAGNISEPERDGRETWRTLDGGATFRFENRPSRFVLEVDPVGESPVVYQLWIDGRWLGFELVDTEGVTEIAMLPPD